MYKKNLEVSLLAFDLNKFSQQLKELKKYDVKYIHYDVMDESYGNAFKGEYLNDLIDNDFLINVHIMATDPLEYIKQFINKRIVSITFQIEPFINKIQSSYQIIDCLNLIKKHNLKAGIAIDPYTKPEDYSSWLNECQIVTIMSVVPGKGGQPFLIQSLRNLAYVYNYRKQNNLDFLIQIDGGIKIDTIDQVRLYVDQFVSGSGFMNANDEHKQKLLDVINQS